MHFLYGESQKGKIYRHGRNWKINYKELSIIEADNGYVLQKKGSSVKRAIGDGFHMFKHQGEPIAVRTPLFYEAMSQYLIGHYDDLLLGFAI